MIRRMGKLPIVNINVPELRSTLARLAVLLVVGLLASACATPIGVVRGDAQTVHRALTRSVLSTGEPSGAIEQVLQWLGLAEAFKKEPEASSGSERGRSKRRCSA